MVKKKKLKTHQSVRSDGHMFLISDLSVPSRTCINTNKCTRRSGLVHVRRENVRQNTEEEPQISQPGPHQHEYNNNKKKEEARDDFSEYQRLLAFHAESDRFHEAEPAKVEKKKNRWKSREVGSTRS